MNMREAFENRPENMRFDSPQLNAMVKATIEYGYAAAIEAVKAGGPVAWRCVENGHLFRQDFPSTEPLYRLPEDV